MRSESRSRRCVLVRRGGGGSAAAARAAYSEMGGHHARLPSQTWHVQVDGDGCAPPQSVRAGHCSFNTVPARLVRHDLKKVGLVIPYKQRFEEFAYDPAVDLSDLDRREGVEELGAESVNGESATSYRATQDGDTILFWLAKTDGVLLKASSTRTPGYALEVRNLKRGPQPASAFELPQGCTRVIARPNSATDVANSLLATLVPSLGC